MCAGVYFYAVATKCFQIYLLYHLCKTENDFKKPFMVYNINSKNPIL